MDDVTRTRALSLTYAEALRYEETRWPHTNTERAFWKRSEVPEHLRDSAAPDAREPWRVFEVACAEHKAKHAAWLESRRAWLRERAEAES